MANNDQDAVVYMGIPLSSLTEKAVPDATDKFLIETEEGPRVSKWENVIEQVTGGWNIVAEEIEDGERVVKKIVSFTGGVPPLPQALTDLVGKYFAAGGGFTTDISLATNYKAAEGKSAYQVALDNGFVGTEVEWQESLVGADGTTTETWTPKPYSATSTVFHNARIWTALDDTLLTDEPNITSKVWKEELKVITEQPYLEIVKVSDSTYNFYTIPILSSFTELYITSSGYLHTLSYLYKVWNGDPNNGGVVVASDTIYGQYDLTLTSLQNTVKIENIPPVGFYITFQTALVSPITAYTDTGLVYPLIRRARVNGADITEETVFESEPLNEMYDVVINHNNKIDGKKQIFNKYVSPNNGDVLDDNDRKAVILPIEHGKDYTFSSYFNLNVSPIGDDGVSFLDANNTAAGFYGNGISQNCTVVRIQNDGFIVTDFPPNAVKIAISLGAKTNEQVDAMRLQFEEGTVATDYAPRNKIAVTSTEAQIAQMQSQITALIAQVNSVEAVPTRWAGKRLVSAGDSITDERYAPSVKYPTMMKEQFNMASLINIATSNSTLSDAGPGILGFMKEDYDRGYKTIDYTQCDLFTMCHAHNDWASSVPIGTLSDTQPTTYMGAFNKLLAYIFNENPQIRVILLTPFQEQNQDIPHVNTGKYLNDYRLAIFEIGKKWSCPVVDIFAESGITSQKMDVYMPDGVHPNAAGHLFAGGYIVNQIKNL